jgi:Fe-S-cluster-containing hydrogenase component 2
MKWRIHVNIYTNNELKKPNNIAGKILIVNLGRCPQNHRCPAMKVCPAGVLSQKEFNAPDVDMNKCIKCGRCVQFCPMNALSLQ